MSPKYFQRTRCGWTSLIEVLFELALPAGTGQLRAVFQQLLPDVFLLSNSASRSTCFGVSAGRADHARWSVMSSSGVGMGHGSFQSVWGRSISLRHKPEN